jgi:hypothetical protein
MEVKKGFQFAEFVLTSTYCFVFATHFSVTQVVIRPYGISTLATSRMTFHIDRELS